MNSTKALSIDTVLLLVLVTIHTLGLNEVVGTLLILAAMTYILLDILVWSDAPKLTAERLFSLKLGLVMLSISLIVLLPLASWMIVRHATQPWKYIHDGAIQIEESIKFLLQGRNPYTEDYVGTPLAQWDYAFEGDEQNPALYHNAYLPFIFIFSTPFYLVSQGLIGWYDQRLVYLGLFVCTLWPLMQHATASTRKLCLLIVFGLNYFAARYTVWGVNDSFVWFWLIMTTYLLQKDKVTLSALCLGLACASKQTAWLFVPFFLAYVWLRAPTPGRWTTLQRAAPVLVVPLLVILPFLLWDAAAFVDDTYLYLSGESASSYPIGGFGFAGLLVSIGVIQDWNAYFPFTLFQAAGCLPLLAFLIKHQVSNNSVRQCWLAYGLLLLTFVFFSRFFNPSYLGIVLNALALGYFSDSAPFEA